MHRDEALAVMVARRPLGELLETVQLVRGGAPLHFLLAKLVAELGGGLVATRAISALGLLLAIVAVGLLGRALGGPAVGAAAAWIVALSPVALFYGDFARMYSLFLAFSALALWCLVRALDTDEPRFWAGTAVLLVLTTYTHPYGVVVGLDRRARRAWPSSLQVRERAAWRLPLYAAAGRDRRHRAARRSATSCSPRGSTRCRSRPGASIPKPSLADVAAQAGAHFVGVPRAGGLIALYLVVCARARARRPRDDRARRRGRAPCSSPRGSSCRCGVLAVVRIPNSDNHVRYVIETLPLAGIAIAYGASTLGRLLGWRGAVAAALAAAALVGAGRGDARRAALRLPLPRRRLGAAQGRPRRRGRLPAHAISRATTSSSATTRRSPRACSRRAATTRSHRRRGTARSEPQLIVRSLKRLHGPIAHGWYVALRGTSDARYEQLPRAPRGRLRRGDVRHVVRARAHARGAADAGGLRARGAARVRGRRRSSRARSARRASRRPSRPPR